MIPKPRPNGVYSDDSDWPLPIRHSVELRHRGVKNYVGNLILDRIDPLSDIRNPWNRLALTYRLPGGLKAFKAERRRGLPIPKTTELDECAKKEADAERMRLYQPKEIKIAGLE